MTRCPSLCGQTPEKKVVKRKQVTEEDKKDLRWTMEEREKREEIEEDHRKVEELVPRCFHKWKKVFGKVESKRMPTQKPWDHTICHKLHLAITPQILARFPRFKMRWKALKKTF